ncbi:MAG: FAD:protein FMN transferase, partial [Synergistaceae bacterium]|jgi:thiamine biosynthesis lipoprotein|nr:FAD:protein FMN transferase [Synergistaceae bacterium]
VITAGVYERSAEIDGKRYTHIFDPRTGYPIGGSLLSATVPSNSPMFGDALSTAFMVMGVEKSLELLYFLPGNDAVFISAGADGALEIIATDGLKSARDANGALGFVAYDRSSARHSGKKRGYRRYVCGPDGLIEAGGKITDETRR